jgi:Zn-dependent peptidase ImmA (M78 family)
LLFCGKNDVCNFANDALNPERQADGFASDLILPTYMVDPRLRKTKRLTLAAARELADEFCTSLLEDSGDLLGTYQGRHDANKALQQIAYQPEPRR